MKCKIVYRFFSKKIFRSSINYLLKRGKYARSIEDTTCSAAGEKFGASLLQCLLSCEQLGGVNERRLAAGSRAADKIPRICPEKRQTPTDGHSYS